MIRRSRFPGALAAVIALSGCAALPTAAPTTSQVVGPLRENGVEVIPIRPDTRSGETITTTQLLPWVIADHARSTQTVQPGDQIHVSIYEVGYGLFGGGGESAAASAGSPSARTFPAIPVPEDGFIRFPYAGSLGVTGLTAGEIAARLEQRLRGKSQFAQVLVSVEPGPARAAVVAGDVTRPGRVALTPAHERLLDAIALAGGSQPRKADTIVRLTRGAAASEARLDAIAATSPENVTLAPGDRIELVRATRTLTVLGAARSVSEIAFDSARLTLSEALSRAGGAEDSKADARGVFIFRYERRERDGAAVAVPVVYRLDLLDPSSYFAAQRFEMREKDVMLVSSAKANQLGKFLQMVNAITTPIVTADILTRP